MSTAGIGTGGRVPGRNNCPSPGWPGCARPTVSRESRAIIAMLAGLPGCLPSRLICYGSVRRVSLPQFFRAAQGRSGAGPVRRRACRRSG